MDVAQPESDKPTTTTALAQSESQKSIAIMDMAQPESDKPTMTTALAQPASYKPATAMNLAQPENRKPTTAIALARPVTCAAYATKSGLSVRWATARPILTRASSPPHTGSSCSTESTPSKPPSYRASTRRTQSTLPRPGTR